MNAFAEKLKSAGVDTFEARFVSLAYDCLRASPTSVEQAWRLLGDRFGHSFLRERLKDMRGAQEPQAGPENRQYRPIVLDEERVVRRKKMADAIRSKYRAFDGRFWSDVGWHELRSMARSGSEAAALSAAGPSYVPNDGRNVGDVLGIKCVDKVIAGVRRRGQSP